MASEAGLLDSAALGTVPDGFLPTSSNANLFNLHFRFSSMASESVRDGSRVLCFLPCTSIVIGTGLV